MTISSAQLEGILPPEVCVEVAAIGDGEASLYPAEAALVGRAVAARRHEFGQGRACARRALGRLGIGPGLLITGDGRAPEWPQGITGSITHTTAFCAAAVAYTSDLRTIGIDAETIGGVTRDLWEVLFLPAEQRCLDRLDEVSAREFATVLFSAKESAFKAQWALTGAYVEFDEAEVAVDSAKRTLSIQGPFGTLRGAYLVRAGLVVTACWRN